MCVVDPINGSEKVQACAGNVLMTELPVKDKNGYIGFMCISLSTISVKGTAA